MTRIIRYITHPQVQIDPAIDVTRWHLSPPGLSRVDALAASGALVGTQSVFSSGETKAVETARPLAGALGCALTIRPQMHENDRSATGFLPPEEFEATADLFFAHPTTSIRGWETALDAQHRIVAEFHDCLETAGAGDVLLVGHGAVGTLLFCHLAGVAISRRHDQGPGGGGSFFQINAGSRTPVCGWQPIEVLITD